MIKSSVISQFYKLKEFDSVFVDLVYCCLFSLLFVIYFCSFIIGSKIFDWLAVITNFYWLFSLHEFLGVVIFTKYSIVYDAQL